MRPAYWINLQRSIVILTTLSSTLVHGASVGLAQSARATTATEQGFTTPSQVILPVRTPVQVRLLQTLNTHKSEDLENVRFEIIRTVWVDDVAVIRKGTLVTGRATTNTPDGLSRNGEIYVTVGSTSAADGTPVSLGGILYEPGQSYCFALDCLGEGGHAWLGDGTEMIAYVTESVSLSTSALRDAGRQLRQQYGRIISDPRLRTRVHVYLMASQELSSARVFFDGRDVVKLAPGERLTLLPAPGRHVIGVGRESLELPVELHGQYYVRILESGSWPRIKYQLRVVAPDVGQDQIEELTGVPPHQNRANCGS